MNYLILLYSGGSAYISEIPTETEPLRLVATPWFRFVKGCRRPLYYHCGINNLSPFSFYHLRLDSEWSAVGTLENSDESEENFQFNVQHSFKKNISHSDR